MEALNNIIRTVCDAVWGPVTLVVILFVGILFGILTRFFQITKIKMWFKRTIGDMFKKDKNKSEGGISAFEAMSAALSGCMGTGNIVGVATALTVGGAGAIFWMWVSAILGMMTAFAENTLAVKFHHKEADGTYSGGPMYYIEKGIKCKPLAVIFCVVCVGASFGIGNMTQSNSVTGAFYSGLGIKPIYTAIVLAVVVGIIIIGGVKRLVKVTSKLVPFMVLLYVISGVIVIACNFQNLGNVFSDIFTQAFGLNQVVGGVSGAVILKSMKSGISRGLFSNEAGLGSSAIAHGASSTKEPVEQGMWGIFQVFTDTIIGCSITALVILSSGVLSSDKDGVELTSLAFSSVFGNFGNIIIFISITLLAFSTIITWQYYGERSLMYLTKDRGAVVYKIIFCLVVILGGVAKLDFVWTLSDTLNGLMIIPNIIALVILSPVVKKELIKYLEKVKAKKNQR